MKPYQVSLPSPVTVHIQADEEDLHRLLELEPKNETALEEMEELRTLRDQAAAVSSSESKA